MESNELNRSFTSNKRVIQTKTNLDKFFKILFCVLTGLCASVIIIVTVFILIKGITPFTTKYLIDGEYHSASFGQFLIGNTYFIYPNIYSVGYIILDTIYVTLLSLIIAIPVSILTALFISKIAPKWLAKILNTVIELLASIPSIVYGLFGAGFITILVKNIGNTFGIQTAGGISTLAVVIVLAMMIIPTITTLSVTAINAVKKDIIHGSYALGASKTQTNFKLVLTSAKSGIFAGIILGVGKALGEATAVSMVAGNIARGPNFSLFGQTRTLTSTLLEGFTETTGLSYDIKYSIGVILIILILLTSLLLNLIKKKIGGSVNG